MALSYFHVVYVSSSDLATLSLANSLGARTIKRPINLSNDFTPTLDVVRHSLRAINEDVDNALVACIYPTALFFNHGHLNAAKGMLEEGIYCFSAFKHRVNPLRSFKIRSDGGGDDLNGGWIEFLDEQYLLNRSQDLEDVFYDAGQFYLAFGRTFKEKSNILSKSSRAVIIDRGVDINDYEDLDEASYLWEKMAWDNTSV